MIQRILNSKNFVACLLAAATGMALYFKLPFPAENIFLQLLALRAPLVHEGLFYSYNLFLFTTPYIAYSIVLSGLYVFGLTVHRRIRAGKLPPYPDARKRQELFVVVGEVHNKRKPVPSETPHWLTIPERGLFTGTAIVGAIGTGKTSCCMYPFAEQILAYRASEQEKRIGGLILEVKGDFCHVMVNGPDRVFIEKDGFIQTKTRFNGIRPPTIPSRSLSQAIRDYLYGRRVLGRGRDPDYIVQQTAVDRAERSDPYDYARRIVSKVLRDLAAERGEPGPTSFKISMLSS